jgi:hypothetical protein
LTPFRRRTVALGLSSVGSLEMVEMSIERIRREHPRAYRSWTPVEDGELADRFCRGMSIQELARLHERQAGGIRSRLRKLGLIQEELTKPDG